MSIVADAFVPGSLESTDSDLAVAWSPLLWKGCDCLEPELCKAPAWQPSCRVPVHTSSLIPQYLAAGHPLVWPAGNRSAAYRLGKRLLDVAGALALLALLGPVMLAVLLVLWVTTRGKPLFVQRRVGYLGCTFRMLKFRTMRPEAEQAQHRVENEQAGPIFKNRRDPRITRFGRFLRKSSLDETPQLLNVLLGQMSLVGPRPLPVHEVAQFEPWQCHRLGVIPGLTCLWQVSGRSDIDFHQWIHMDLWYVKNQNLWTDCKLLLLTPLVVLTGRGAY